METSDLTIEDLPDWLVCEIADEAISQYFEAQRQAEEDPDDPRHWGSARAARYSSEDETAMAAFNYASDSAEVDRWR